MHIDELTRLFELIDLEKIESFVTEPGQQEYLNLDFKLLAGGGRFERDDKKNLAKALSGFANSDGGVLVWGIETQLKDGVDTAVAKRPITNLTRARSQAESLTGELVSPVIGDVLHKTIKEAAAANTGYLVTLVPASDAGPHMATGAGGRYYKRSGDSFYPMEHFDIEDMFGRRAKPKLSLSTDVRRGGGSSGPDGGSYNVFVILGVRNSGRGLARFPYLALRMYSPYSLNRFGLDGNGNTGLLKLPSGDPMSEWNAFGGGADDVIHVNSVLEVTTVKREVRRKDATCPPDLVVDFRIAAEGVLPVERQHVVPGEELRRVAYPDSAP